MRIRNNGPGPVVAGQAYLLPGEVIEIDDRQWAAVLAHSQAARKYLRVVAPEPPAPAPLLPADESERHEVDARTGAPLVEVEAAAVVMEVQAAQQDEQPEQRREPVAPRRAPPPKPKGRGR